MSLFSLLTLVMDSWLNQSSAARFNRREDDFSDLKAYNDYLEEVEEISELHSHRTI